jgi:signal transduction histidine kinase
MVTNMIGSGEVMTQLIDKAGIFVVCLVIYIIFSNSVYLVVPVILVTIISSLNSYFEKPPHKTIGVAAFSVLALFFPGLMYFIPLICYDCFMEKHILTIFFMLVALTVVYRNISGSVLIIIFALIIISYIIKYHSIHLGNLRREYINLRDDMVEFSQKLTHKNEELMEKQDYDVKLATLNERNRIAREIHDSVGHVMSSAILQVGALMATAKEDDLKENLSDLQGTLTGGMNSIRESVHNLHDDSVDLYSQLEKLVRAFTFCPITFDYDMGENLSSKVRYAIIAIVKEALSNIITHSDATHVSLVVREHPGLYQVIVSDNGTKKSYSFEGGMGLNNIKARVENLGGVFNIDTQRGFKLFVSIRKEVE